MTSPFIMTNSWSLLYDELKMDEYPYSDYQFTLSEGGDGTLNLKKTPVMSEPKNHLWKYNEDKILKDVQDYVTSTYEIGRAHV